MDMPSGGGGRQTDTLLLCFFVGPRLMVVTDWVKMDQETTIPYRDWEGHVVFVYVRRWRHC